MQTSPICDVSHCLVYVGCLKWIRVSAARDTRASSVPSEKTVHSDMTHVRRDDIENSKITCSSSQFEESLKDAKLFAGDEMQLQSMFELHMKYAEWAQKLLLRQG